MGSRAAAWLFDRYVRRLVSRHFAAVHWIDAGAAFRRGRMHPAPATSAPATMFVANHTNWWDGFLAWLVSRELGLHFHILMEAGNLDRYWMFKLIGALPMHRDNRQAAYRDLTAAGSVLQSAGNSLWIFPQGARRPPEETIRSTEHGAAHLALEHRTEVVPVAFRYRYIGEQYPEAFIQLGDPIANQPDIDRRALAAEIESRMRLTVADLDQRLRVERMDGLELLLQGRLSVNKRLDQVRHAAGTLDGPFESRNG